MSDIHCYGFACAASLNNNGSDIFEILNVIPTYLTEMKGYIFDETVEFKLGHFKGTLASPFIGNYFELRLENGQFTKFDLEEAIKYEIDSEPVISSILNNSIANIIVFITGRRRDEYLIYCLYLDLVVLLNEKFGGYYTNYGFSFLNSFAIGHKKPMFDSFILSPYPFPFEEVEYCELPKVVGIPDYIAIS